jgi:hypothetical protein
MERIVNLPTLREPAPLRLMPHRARRIARPAARRIIEGRAEPVERPRGAPAMRAYETARARLAQGVGRRLDIVA